MRYIGNRLLYFDALLLLSCHGVGKGLLHDFVIVGKILWGSTLGSVPISSQNISLLYPGIHLLGGEVLLLVLGWS